MKLAQLHKNDIVQANKAIQWVIETLRYSRDRDNVNELEYMIYELSNLIYDSKSIYLRNYYTIEREKDRMFIERRKNETSDLKTTKSINNDLREDITTLELQDEFIELCAEQLKAIKRLADNINNMRIADMADAKRSQI